MLTFDLIGKKAHEHQRRLLAPSLKYGGTFSSFNTMLTKFVIYSSAQSIRNLADIFFETSRYLANQWSQKIDMNGGGETEIEITDWAGRFA